jgi:preprotein translocase subunit SecF
MGFRSGPGHLAPRGLVLYPKRPQIETPAPAAGSGAFMRLLRLVPKNTKLDFVRLRWWGFAFTGITILLTILSLAVQGLNLGIDFTGGVIVEVRKTDGGIDFDAMRTKMEGLGFGEVAIQGVSGGECDAVANSCALLRVQPSKELAGQEQVAIQQILDRLGPGYVSRKQDVVGARVSGELFTQGVIAASLAIVMIALYVAFRFEWQFGVAAFISTFHDVFITVGLFAVLQLDFNLTSIAALLTLAGYSINDTVVVFDRIRENRRKYKKKDLKELINISTNETLSRTTMTSLSTAIAILPLFLFGGDTLLNFSAAILFGIAIGTYSSIYVASALLLYLPPISAMEPPKLDKQAAARP